MLGDRFPQSSTWRAGGAPGDDPALVRGGDEALQRASSSIRSSAPRQLGPNDAMTFFQILLACDARSSASTTTTAARDPGGALRAGSARPCSTPGSTTSRATTPVRPGRSRRGNAEALVQALFSPAGSRRRVTKALPPSRGGRSRRCCSWPPSRGSAPPPRVSPLPPDRPERGVRHRRGAAAEAAVATDLGDGARRGEPARRRHRCRSAKPRLHPPPREDPRPARPGRTCRRVSPRPGREARESNHALGALTRRRYPERSHGHLRVRVPGDGGLPAASGGGAADERPAADAPPADRRAPAGISRALRAPRRGADASYDAADVPPGLRPAVLRGLPAAACAARFRSASPSRKPADRGRAGPGEREVPGLRHIEAVLPLRSEPIDVAPIPR
jgi:hypothetical protein